MAGGARRPTKGAVLWSCVTNNYPFHTAYVRALTSGNIPALRKLIRRALRAKPQKEFFTGDKTGKPMTHFEELATAVWRTFEAGHVEHGRLFLAAGLPVPAARDWTATARRAAAWPAVWSGA